MVVVSSSIHGDLSPQNALKLARAHLENAQRTDDPELAALLYNEARAALSRMKQPTLEVLLSSGSNLDQYLSGEITYVVSALDEMLNGLKQHDKLAAGVEAEGSDVQSTDDDLVPSDGTIVADPQNHQTAENDSITIPRHIFAENKRPPTVEFTLPGRGERLKSTPQLVYCLTSLQAWRSSIYSTLEPAAQNWAHNWAHNLDADEDEMERIESFAPDVVRAFGRCVSNDPKLIAEVACLAPVLDKAVYRDLLGQLYKRIEQSLILDTILLEGLAQVIRYATLGYLEAADLTMMLRLFEERLCDIQEQPMQHVYELVLAVSSVLDAMADANVKDLNYDSLREPLSDYLNGLKAMSDPYLVYQAAYTYQALQHIPDQEPVWQTALGRNGRAKSGQPNIIGTFNPLDLSEFFAQLRNIYSLSDASKVKSQETSEQTLQDYLQEARSFECKQAWYPALRMADILLQSGRFAEFKALVYETPCRKDPAFQWGLCQCLRELGFDPKWDTETRQDAIPFLEEVYRNNAIWGNQANVKQRIVITLAQLASQPESVKQTAEVTLKHLRINGDTRNRHTDQEEQNSCYDSCLFEAFESRMYPTLLDRVQDTPDVEILLRQLRKQRLKCGGSALYIETQAKATIDSSDQAPFLLMDKVKEFLNTDLKVFLVVGTSGVGKSTFCRELEYTLWKSYQTMGGHVPLYIDLTSIDNPNQDLVARQLQKAGFNSDQINEMRLYKKFVLICDEYDQIQDPENLYVGNELNQPGGWNVKMVVCSRIENLGANYLRCFQPMNQDCEPQPELLRQAVIIPLHTDQVQDYINRYVSKHSHAWKADDFLQALGRNSDMKDVAESPLLLSLFLEVMPRMVESWQHLSTKKFTRVEVYDHIIENWFESSRRRLEEENSSPQTIEAFDRLTSDGFVSSGIHYLKRLTAAIYKNQDGVSVVEYSRLRDVGTWKEEFFLHDEMNRLLHRASPLKCSGSKLQFVHPSILEYGLALTVFDPQEARKTTTRKPSLSRRGSADSVMSFEMNDPCDDGPTVTAQGLVMGSPLSWRSFVDNPLVLHFLEERVQQEPLFEQQLMAFIELSKTDKVWRTASANAITILVGAGIHFNGFDLRGIRIPGANLSHGMFECAQLQGADLRKTTLRSVCLANADLSQALMKGVRFGEFLSLIEESSVHSCAYSPDARHFAVGLGCGLLTLYSTSNWERIRKLGKNSHSITNVSFSPGGNIVSASFHRTIRLWDVETGTCLNSLTGHTNKINGAVFSPRGDYIASCSSDKTIRLWNVESGECRSIFSGHKRPVQDVAFSPTGDQIAFLSSDNTVRFWTIDSGVCRNDFSGHYKQVNTMAYAPNGRLFVTGSNDKTVQLWDVETGACRHTLRGHFGRILSVIFSPLSDLIASGSSDKSVRLWNVDTGVCQYVFLGYYGSIKAIAFSLKGHQIAYGCGNKVVRVCDVQDGIRHDVPHGHVGSVWSVAISPKDGRVASGGDDMTLRLWDFDTGLCLKILRGHQGGITGVAFPLRGEQVASCSFDKTVRLWDTVTGNCRQILSGHTDRVRSIAFSPNGDHFASGGDDQTVRVWNAETGTCNIILSGHQGSVASVAFSRWGQVVSGGRDKKIRVWNAVTGVGRKTISGHTDAISSIIFSPKDDRVASGSRSVCLCNTTSETLFRVVGIHSAPITSVVFSPSGDLVASSSADKTVRIWEAESGVCRATMDCFQASVNSLAWATRSGVEYLLTGDSNGLVQLWQMKEDGGQWNASWSSTSSQLNMTGASVQGVQGLSSVDARLLKQRGAVDEPVLKR
ncbi:MAG: WD40-repeat-containing domain protein [Benniella sp.]|nr:MAG: WD40-repeat-containing domain protein [Benniella sp.]